MSKLLCVGGYATSGKDAFADILVKKHDWYKTYMSKPLELALLTLDPFILRTDPQYNPYWRYSQLHAEVGYDQSKKDPEVRRLLQTLGTEVGRNMFGENVWLDLVIDECLTQGKNAVITGIRYPNELERWKDVGARAIWIDRPGVEPVNTHSSDNTLYPEDFDQIVFNNGTLEDLEKAVEWWGF